MFSNLVPLGHMGRWEITRCSAVITMQSQRVTEAITPDWFGQQRIKTQPRTPPRHWVATSRFEVPTKRTRWCRNSYNLHRFYFGMNNTSNTQTENTRFYRRRKSTTGKYKKTWNKNIKNVKWSVTIYHRFSELRTRIRVNSKEIIIFPIFNLKVKLTKQAVINCTNQPFYNNQKVHFPLSCSIN